MRQTEKGGKRPQVEISINNIILDDRNPRLVQYTESISNPLNLI